MVGQPSDDDDEFREVLQAKKRAGGRVRGKRSAAYANRKKEGAEEVTKRLHSGRQEMIDAGKGKEGVALLVARVTAALKLSVVPESVPCREDQEKRIRDRILSRIRTNASDMLYICGQPGTGKTLTVHRVVELVTSMRDEGKLPYVRKVCLC